MRTPSHRSDVTEVHREKLMSNLSSRGIGTQEMPSFDHGVGREEQKGSFSLAAGDNGAVISYAQEGKMGASSRLLGSPKRFEGSQQSEFTEVRKR